MTIKKKTITRLKEYNQRQYLKSILRNHHELTVNVRIFINKASLEFGLLNKKKNRVAKDTRRICKLKD